MNKIISFLLLVSVLYGCSNDEYSSSPETKSPLEVGVKFLKLSDDGNNIAGQLLLSSNMEEVKVQWNTDAICNLDTTQLVVRMKNGNGTLPIKWLQESKNGFYGPEHTAYKAGVLLTAGEYSQYVPLVWSEKVDSAKIMESIPLTRTLDSTLPRVAQITMTPTTVRMNYQTGGTMYVGLNEVPFAVFDLSEFTSDLNIDMSLLPDMIESSRMISFKWTAAGAPLTSFSANFIAMAEGITQIGAVTYTVAGTTLSYESSNLPTGNIPPNGGNYTFLFLGTYTDGLQVRAIIDGVAQEPGISVTNKQPQATIGANSGTAPRNVKFEYRRADTGTWTQLPVSTDRVQDGKMIDIQLSANPVSLSFARASGSKSTLILTNDPAGWNATSNVDWLTITPSGMNNATLNVAATATTVNRSGIITVTSLSDPTKTANISVTQMSNYAVNGIIIAINQGSAAWGTAMGLTGTYNNSTTSPWTVVYKYPAGIYNPVPDNDGMTAVPWIGCKGYSEMPDGSDKGTWRLPTLSEVGSIQPYYPSSYWAAESYANNGGTGTTPLATTMSGPAAYGARPGSYIWLGRGNGGNYRCVKKI